MYAVFNGNEHLGFCSKLGM